MHNNTAICITLYIFMKITKENKQCHVIFLFFTMAPQPLVGQGFLIIKASRSYSDTPQSVGLLWTSDQPDAETST